MKKSILALAVSVLATGAWAQVSAPTTPVLAPLPTGANPFTGVTKAQTAIDKSENELKRLRSLSTQNLSLQRDELEALRIELDKRKILNELNPPKPPPEVRIVPVATTGEKAAARAVSKARAAVVAPAPAPTPPQIIAPSASKYEPPQILGVIDIAGQKVAMVKFDNKTFRVASGAMVGGKPIGNIEPSGLQWGNSFLKVFSSDNAPPSFVITDEKVDRNRTAAAPSAPIAAQAPMYNGSPTQVALYPQGATRQPMGSPGPAGVLQLPPPPPSLSR